MSHIYTCPYCYRQYSVEAPGDYACRCGKKYHFPPYLSSAGPTTVNPAPVYAGYGGGGVHRTFSFSGERPPPKKVRTEDMCLISKLSLACGILGIVFFGILSIPALILGLSAELVISNSLCKRGKGAAIAGIITGLAGTIIWSAILFSLL